MIITTRKLMAHNMSTTIGLDSIPSRILEKIISEIPKTRRSPIRAKRDMSFIAIPFLQKNLIDREEDPKFSRFTWKEPRTRLTNRERALRSKS
jgi:hypothetical protein